MHLDWYTNNFVVNKYLLIKNISQLSYCLNSEVFLVNEGVIFIWFAWCIWTYATFILPRNHPLRFSLAFHCLMIIILSTYFIKMDFIYINVAIFYLLLLAIWYMRKSSFKSLIYNFLTVILYISMKIFYLMDPVVFYYKEKLFLLILCYILCFLLFSTNKERVGNLFLMVGLGEWLFAYIITYYFETSYTMGLGILDGTLVTFVLLIISKVFISIVSDWKNIYDPLREIKKKQM